jgi:hypothetical protein
MVLKAVDLLFVAWVFKGLSEGKYGLITSSL